MIFYWSEENKLTIRRFIAWQWHPSTHITVVYFYVYEMQQQCLLL